MAGKTYLACALGMAQQFLLRAVHPSAGSAGGNLRGPSQRHLPGLYEKAEERELLILDEWLLYPFKKAETRDVPLSSAPSMIPASGTRNLYGPFGRCHL